MSSANIFVISSPSGGGKTSLVRALVAKTERLVVSVSHTTRGKRDDEVDGENYYFVEVVQFQRLLSASSFLEHAEVFGNYYGTSKQQVLELIEGGTDVVLEIDWQGAKQIKEQFPAAVLIFVLPPSLETLRERLEKRAKDSPAVIEQRLNKATWEMKQYGLFDYLVVNDDFEVAVSKLASIVETQRLRTGRQQLELQELIANLLPE